MAEEGNENWTDEHEFSDSTKKIVSRFKSEGDGENMVLMPSSLADGYANLYKAHKNVVAFPDEDASDEDRATAMDAIHKRLGVPDGPDGYELVKPEQMPEGVGWSDDFANDWKKFCHDNKIQPKQAQAIADYHFGMVSAQAKAGIDSRAEETATKVKAQADVVETLTKELGGEEQFKAYVANCTKGVAWVNKNILKAEDADKGLAEIFEKSSLGDSPEMLKLFNWFYDEKVKEDKMVPGAAGKVGESDDPESLQKRYFPNSPGMNQLGAGR